MIAFFYQCIILKFLYMEDKTFLLPYLLSIFISTMIMFFYQIWWEKRYPWFHETDEQVQLSLHEREFRKNIRRKFDIVKDCWLIFIGSAFLGLMLAGIFHGSHISMPLVFLFFIVLIYYRSRKP